MPLFLGGIIIQLPNTGHGSKNILISFTNAASCMKRAVNCDKNSGCRLHEQRRSEFSNELHLSFQQM